MPNKNIKLDNVGIKSKKSKNENTQDFIQTFVSRWKTQRILESQKIQEKITCNSNVNTKKNLKKTNSLRLRTNDLANIFTNFNQNKSEKYEKYENQTKKKNKNDYYIYKKQKPKTEIKEIKNITCTIIAGKNATSTMIYDNSKIGQDKHRHGRSFLFLADSFVFWYKFQRICGCAFIVLALPLRKHK